MFEPITLEGKFVQLVPLSWNHFEALCEVGLEEELWRWTPTKINNASDLKRYIEIALEDQQHGLAIPFATIEKSSEKIIGSTRFANIDVKNRRVEIGWTWINPKWQKTFVNTEAKLLMLTHAFESWKCIRVELKTDALNEKSRKAILRLGASEEGIFRQHIITDSGRHRDTVYYSILDREWPQVKSKLSHKLG